VERGTHCTAEQLLPSQFTFNTEYQITSNNIKLYNIKSNQTKSIKKKLLKLINLNWVYVFFTKDAQTVTQYISVLFVSPFFQTHMTIVFFFTYKALLFKALAPPASHKPIAPFTYTKPVKMACCTKFRYKDILSRQTGNGAKLKMAACDLNIISLCVCG
jgi:hypothetical protein